MLEFPTGLRIEPGRERGYAVEPVVVRIRAEDGPMEEHALALQQARADNRQVTIEFHIPPGLDPELVELVTEEIQELLKRHGYDDRTAAVHHIQG